MRLDPKTLERLAHMVCGNVEGFPYRTGSDLTSFFENLGLPFAHRGQTRGRWVEDRLHELNEGVDRANPDLPPPALADVIERLASPMEYESPEALRLAVLKLNYLLRNEGLRVLTEGDRPVLVSLVISTALPAEPRPDTVHYVPPRSQLDAYVLLKDTMDGASASLVVVDPYVDDSTLQPLLAVKPGVSIRLLTVKPSKDFAHAVERFREQWGGNIEARKGTKELHDRFLLVDGRVFFSGASFKDLGQRGSMIDEIRSEAVKDAVRKDVEASWKQAQPIG